MSAGGPVYPVPPPANPGTPPPPVTYGTPPPFPAVANAEAIYSGPDGLYDSFSAYHGSSLPTRYVLFRDSTFQLQFASYRFGVFTYHGRYTRTNEAIDFFYGDSSSATWGATGILRGDTLEIRYSPDMSMSDFLDGSYVRVR